MYTVKRKEPVRVPFDAAKINRMLGTDISEEEMIGYFKKIDLGYDAETKEVIAPTFRHDLFRIADLAEEVARFYGYDNIPTTLPDGEATTGKLSLNSGLSRWQEILQSSVVSVRECPTHLKARRYSINCVCRRIHRS